RTRRPRRRPARAATATDRSGPNRGRRRRSSRVSPRGRTHRRRMPRSARRAVARRRPARTLAPRSRPAAAEHRAAPGRGRSPSCTRTATGDSPSPREGHAELVPGRSDGPHAGDARASRRVLGPVEERVPASGRGEVDLDLLLADDDVAVADHQPVRLEDAEPVRVQLRVAKPAGPRLGVEAPLVAERLAVEADDVAGVVLAQAPEHQTGGSGSYWM